jgi:hypothetical protein
MRLTQHGITNTPQVQVTAVCQRGEVDVSSPLELPVRRRSQTMDSNWVRDYMCNTVYTAIPTTKAAVQRRSVTTMTRLKLPRFEALDGSSFSRITR